MARPIGLMRCPKKRTLRGQCDDTFKLECPLPQAEVADICAPTVCNEAHQQTCFWHIVTATADAEIMCSANAP
jgi:hypothetical protein